MKFSLAVVTVIDQMRSALMVGIPPVFRAIYHSPSLLFNFAALSRISMAAIWIPFGQGGDSQSSGDKKNLITPHATGVVLDIGAGHGHTVNYLDREKVTKYIALEPNVHMHSYIRQMAEAAGYLEANDSFLILTCGAEDTESIMSSLHAKVDTIISVLTLCTVPGPQHALRALVQDILVPGGELLFYEHVLSHRSDVAWWQKFWTPVWGKVFDGCCLNRPTHLWIKGLLDDNNQSIWSEGNIWNPSDSDEEHLFWRQLGRFVKK
ncbi:hypothetical protein C8R43DRAFT_1036872 [Mycena crocata]|nr:hypothetical protein C8R43DRAFT_1036872 [Mycena crocata]